MQTIYLDISNKGVIPCIHAKQSEVGRKFVAVITDNGVPYDIPSNSMLSVWYEGNADAGNYSSIEQKSAFEIEGNKVTVELVAQMLLKPGSGEMCLSITHGDGGETNTWNIPYEVERKPGAGSSVPTQYYTALTEVSASTARYAAEAKQYAENAKTYITERIYTESHSAHTDFGFPIPSTGTYLLFINEIASDTNVVSDIGSICILSGGGADVNVKTGNGSVLSSASVSFSTDTDYVLDLSFSKSRRVRVYLFRVSG